MGSFCLSPALTTTRTLLLCHQSIPTRYSFVHPPPPPDDDVALLQPDEASINSGSSLPKAKSMPIPQPSGSVGDADDASVVSDALLLQPKSWKPWYQKIRKTIDTLELPGQWSMVMMYLTLLEGRNKFWIGDKTTVLLATDRPKWLSHWIRCG